jgi:predicted glutamine amidotransferase
MCIAIYKPADKLISKETLEECFIHNPHGAGFMYVENKSLKVKKGFFTFAEFWDAYQPYQSLKSVIHFRIKTHGDVLKENCHPFNVTKNLGFVHNGIISGFGSDKVSDTREFNRLVMQPLVAKWGKLALFEEPVQELLESRISYSKLIFLDSNNNETIFNEEKGVWDDEVWYSNTSYKPRVVAVLAPYVKPIYQSTIPLAFKSPYEAPKASQFFQMGESIYLLKNHYDDVTKMVHPKDSIWEIVAINNNYTVDLSNEFDNTFLYDVPYNKVEYYDWTRNSFDKGSKSSYLGKQVDYGYYAGEK